MQPIFVIIEGASRTASLSSYLESAYGFEVIRYDPLTEPFPRLIDRVVFSIDRARLCLCPGHLTALVLGYITEAYFREFESAVSLARCKLILTTERGKGVRGTLADAYARSWLEKRALDDGQGVADVLEWIGLGQEATK